MTEAVIRMFNGRMVDVFNLTHEDVVPMNFIHSVCNLNRYTGHTPFPISVGQHSLMMQANVPQELKQAAIIHDWSEACFNDLASPIKRHMKGYKDREIAASRVIYSAMGVDYELSKAIKPYDVMIRQDERIATWGYTAWFQDQWKFDNGAQPIGITFKETPWREVRQEFTDAFVRWFPEQDLITW